MIRIVAAIAAAAAIALTPASSPARAAAKAAARDWSRTVSVTPAGGFRMGNPAAPVKLVEYGSLGCSHCRNFAETGFKPLVQRYVRGGRVSYEFRNFLLSGPDLAASLLARCAGTARFFPMTDAIFAAQPQWQRRIAGMSDADKAALERLSDQQRIVRLAEIGQLTTIAGRFGVSSARARQCLADEAASKRLIDMTQSAMDSGVNRTPTFLINGKTADAATWEDLEPLIRRAAGNG